jgi:acyl-CoA synthetase (AMP-forming)/AMP-acid ligase II
VLLNDMTATPVYLWTVPMFHCNGWCVVWGVAAQGGTNVCLRKGSPAAIFDSLARHGVTHMGGAPTVLSMIVNATAEERRPLPGGRRVTFETGGAPPPPEVLFRMEELGFVVIHSYGLTETYGSATVCTWKPEWDALPAAERAEFKSRKGLHHQGLEVDAKDPVTMRSVPADGRTMGEVMFRGNTVMSGYYKDAAATAEAMAGGWLRSGNLAVRHGDGYVKILDRSKDIIISGGENISTIEVEAALFAHPAVAEAAVVGRADEYWGETPCAFVTLKAAPATAWARRRRWTSAGRGCRTTWRHGRWCSWPSCPRWRRGRCRSSRSRSGPRPWEASPAPARAPAPSREDHRPLSSHRKPSHLMLPRQHEEHAVPLQSSGCQSLPLHTSALGVPAVEPQKDQKG